MRIVFAALLLVGCVTSKEKNQNLQIESLTLQRTPCYGTCPQYTLYMEKNGMVKFAGKRFTEKIGQWELKSDADSIGLLFQKMEMVDWGAFDSIYPSPYSDLPSIVIKINARNFSKSITITGEHPSKLDSIVSDLDRWSSMPGYEKITD